MLVDIALLGRFAVVPDGVPVPDDAWSRRGAASLVKLLALTDGRRMHREQVMDALWPGVSVEAAGPRLHKAAHYARRALGDGQGRLQLRHDQVLLLPDDEVSVDAVVFRRLGEAAIASGSVADAEQALEAYGGTLLPDDLYEPWAAPTRDALEALREDLLRLAGRWEDLLRANPVDEEAHLVLARQYADRGDQRAALRQLERMDQALRRELGTVPERRGPVAARRARPSRRRARGPLATPGRGPAGGSPRPGRLLPRADGPGRLRPRQHRTAHRRSRGRQDRPARPGRLPGPAPWLADRARRRIGGRGLVALRAGAGGVRATSAAGIPRCSTGWTTTTATSSTVPWPARRSRGAARPRTSGSSSLRPS